MIKKIFNNATNTLLEVDRELDSIKSMKTMLITGIGCHHSGLIPIIKEITELLFQEGLLKILFATETFAMGINMPAKTVIFAHLQKWDGTTERFLTSEEYTQMSGRAGRRGHDKYGTSIIVIDSSFNSTQCVKMTSLGTPPLSSSFRLTYNMLLNLKKADIQQIRQVINSSFYLFLIENQTLMVGKKKKKLKMLINRTLNRKKYEAEAKLYLLKNIIKEKIDIFFSKYSSRIIRYFVSGRLVWISSENHHFGWGIIIGTKLRYTPNKFFVDVLTQCTLQQEAYSITKPGRTSIKIIRFRLSSIKRLSPFIINLPINLKSKEKIRNIWKKTLLFKKQLKWLLERGRFYLSGFLNRFQLLDGLPILDPIKLSFF